MTDTPNADDWAGDRGTAWHDSLGPLEAMLAPVNGPLLRALDLSVPCRVADIGCGGGETSLAIAHSAPVGSEIVGVDISPALIDAARAKPAPPSAAISFTVADAGAAPAPGAAFDRLASRFGVMFFEHPPLAFSNLRRWMRPGGQFAFAVWGPPADNPWMSEIRAIAARHVDLPEPDPDGPGPFRYQDADGFCTLLRSVGFADVSPSGWRGQLPIGGGLSPSAAAEFVMAAFSFTKKAADGPNAASAREELISLFARHADQDVVRMNAHAHIVTGVVL